jgi:hypothetical protein
LKEMEVFSAKEGMEGPKAPLTRPKIIKDKK